MESRSLAALGMTLRRAQRVVVLTGAGVSAESGMPTFRDPQKGLWSRYRPEELATPEAFERDPELVWRWYRWRRELARRAAPNKAHDSLANWESRVAHFHLVTQNVDGLHARAGSRCLLELHGNLFRNRCSREGKVIVDDNDDPSALPRCPDCQALLRPDVVWFGEALAEAVLEQAFAASETCEILLSVGTSSLVYPAAALPGHAQQHGAQVVEINTRETPLTAAADLSLRGAAAQLLPRLLAE